MVPSLVPQPHPHFVTPKNESKVINVVLVDHHARILTHLNRCSNMRQLKQIHAHTLRTTSPHQPQTMFLYSRILHFSSLYDLRYAFRVFDGVKDRNSFMWNSLIRVCAQEAARKQEAIELYRRMLEDKSVEPDKHTFPFVLKACAYLFALSEGKQVHGQVLKHGLGPDVYVNNSLIHFYGSCGFLDMAKKVFNEMPERSLVSWNAMIDALVQFGEFDHALKLFETMKNRFEPDGYTMQSVINACAGLGSLCLGMWAHAFVLKKCDSDVSRHILINNSLIDMYCKCGSVEMADQVFNGMRKRDLTSWNSMILGFATHGKAEKALETFAQMTNSETFEPNSITFVGILTACNHKGLVNEGKRYFDIMVTRYNIEPALEHYGCMVDLLARARFMEEALDLVSSMPMKPDGVIWRSLLDACSKTIGNVELSEEMAKRVLETEGGNASGAYVLLSRVYASARRWNDVGLIRKLMTDHGVIKEPGCSSLEINGTSHEFFAGDTSHTQTREIYQMLDVIDQRLQSTGYVPDSSQASLVDQHRESKESSLKLHSERIAIAFGLLNSEPGTPIRVLKNLRVCKDCHQVSKLTSKLFDVEIIMRDRVRFHHFSDGSCSCLDYW